MAIPSRIREEAESLLNRYCRVPEHIQNQLRYGYLVRNGAITLFDERPHFQNKDRWITSSFARFRYSASRGDWTLYYSDQHGKWHRYELLEPHTRFAVLLKEVDKDPTGIFYG